MAHIKVIHDPVGKTLTVYWDNPEHEEICEEVGQGTILIKDVHGEVIGFERLYFKPKEAPQELGVVLQTATSQEALTFYPALLLLSYLCQCCLSLEKPEGHVHGAVEVNGVGKTQGYIDTREHSGQDDLTKALIELLAFEQGRNPPAVVHGLTMVTLEEVHLPQVERNASAINLRLHAGPWTLSYRYE